MNKTFRGGERDVASLVNGVVIPATALLHSQTTCENPWVKIVTQNITAATKF
jgi:hypothetical protein